MSLQVNIGIGFLRTNWSVFGQTLSIQTMYLDHQTATAMAILKMFDFDFHALLGRGANTLHKVVTVDAELHTAWDDLAFWFEVDGQVCLLVRPPKFAW
jgi:hypothetical protein